MSDWMDLTIRYPSAITFFVPISKAISLNNLALALSN